VLRDVAYAVQFMHSMQLVHGDIKAGWHEGAGAAQHRLGPDEPRLTLLARAPTP
jgi:serine/threonine protein kinase